jgi:hypothetical protein
MKFLHRALLATALVCAGVSAATPASAEPVRAMYVAGVAACDPAAGEWVITWTVANGFDVPGTVGNVRVTPAGHPLAGLDPVIEPGATATGTQRIPASMSSASVTLDVNWLDGPVTYNTYRPAYIKASCQAL